MSYYPEPDNHIRDKVKVVLDLSNYATKKELDHDTGVDTSDLASIKDFIAVKAEVDKIEINPISGGLFLTFQRQEKGLFNPRQKIY